VAGEIALKVQLLDRAGAIEPAIVDDCGSTIGLLIRSSDPTKWNPRELPKRHTEK
jgi:hypothetical protein